MGMGSVAGVPGLTPRDASAAIALVTAATEERYEIVGFFAGRDGFRKRGRAVHGGYAAGLTPLALSPRQRLDDAGNSVPPRPFVRNATALPVLRGRARGRYGVTFALSTGPQNFVV